jgi:hypothetical protein
VAPAKRSQAALDKVHTRTLADGTPAMSFTRLLAHLATVVRNTLRPKSARRGEATFTLTTRPPKTATGLDRRHHRVASPIAPLQSQPIEVRELSSAPGTGYQSIPTAPAFITSLTSGCVSQPELPQRRSGARLAQILI